MTTKNAWANKSLDEYQQKREALREMSPFWAEIAFLNHQLISEQVCSVALCGA